MQLALCRAPGAFQLSRVGTSRGRDVMTATARSPKDTTQGELHLKMLRQMLLIRRFEEKAAEAYALGKIGGFCHLYIGPGAGAGGAPAPVRGHGYRVLFLPEPGQAPT